MRLRLAKSYVVGQIYPMLLRLLININRIVALLRKWVEIAMFLEADGQPLGTAKTV
jgi:hypothetical protein